MDIYAVIKNELKSIAGKYLHETLKIISARPLKPEEVIGNPERKDFPLLKGKKFMIEASFRDSKGHAFTDMPGNFEGTIYDLLEMEMDNNFHRALLIAGLNAVMKSFSLITNTIHCKDNEPKKCAEMLPGFIKEKFGHPKIAFIGYQPAMIERLSKEFSMRVIDLDKDNIDSERFGIKIEGPENTEDAIRYGDIVVATGSTCANNTIGNFFDKKPVVFYGVSVAGFAKIFNLMRFCPYGR